MTPSEWTAMIQADPWLAAVDDALICAGLDCTGPGSDPRKCLNDLVRWSTTMALDPAVSEEASELYARGWADALQSIAKNT